MKTIILTFFNHGNSKVYVNVEKILYYFNDHNPFFADGTWIIFCDRQSVKVKETPEEISKLIEIENFYNIKNKNA